MQKWRKLSDDISIHAPHEGERLAELLRYLSHMAISIHAPHEGERLVHSWYNPSKNAFQSTLPTRGSDDDGVTLAFDDGSISIHAPHEGERRDKLYANTP